MASPTVVVSVLGLSRLDGENFSSHNGLGKSCLCYRFMYPGYDDYIEDLDHRSLLALYEFQSDVYRDNFLYWGSKTKTYNAKGSSQKVQFEVLEHTVFYEDITEKPFKTKDCVWNLDGYIKAATNRGALQGSRSKVSYQNSALICQPEEYKSVQFPFSSIEKHPRGFLLAVDVSDSGATFDARLRATGNTITQLTKRKLKFVVAATKRDEACLTSLEKVNELARQGKFPFIECSAKSNVNVSETFEMIAAQVLGKSAPGLTTHVRLYHDSERKTLRRLTKARLQFSKYLKKRVTQSRERLKAIECTKEYKICRLFHGKFETDKMFAEHVLLLRDKEVDSFVGVKNAAIDLRKKFLEDYVAERTDLSLLASQNYFTDLILKICSKYGDNTTYSLLPCTPLSSEPLYCLCKDPAPDHEMRKELVAADQSCLQKARRNGDLKNSGAEVHVQDDSHGQQNYIPMRDNEVYGMSWEESHEYMYIACQPGNEVESYDDSSEEEQTIDEIERYSPQLGAGAAAMMAVLPQQYGQPPQYTSPPVKPSNAPRCAPITPNGTQVTYVGGTEADSVTKQSAHQCIHIINNHMCTKESVDVDDEYADVTGGYETMPMNIGENSDVENEMACLSPTTATESAESAMVTMLPQVQPHWKQGEPMKPLQSTVSSVKPLKAPIDAAYPSDLS